MSVDDIMGEYEKERKRKLIAKEIREELAAGKDIYDILGQYELTPLQESKYLGRYSAGQFGPISKEKILSIKNLREKLQRKKLKGKKRK